MSTSKLTEDYIIMNGISHLWQSSDKDSFSASNFAKWSAYSGERSLSSSNSEYRSTTFKSSISHSSFLSARLLPFKCKSILGDPGADSGGEGKSKRAGKYGTKKSKERREEPLGRMSYQTSSKRSSPFWPLIGARKLLCFSAQSEASSPMGRFVYPYTEWYMKGSCSLCLCGPFAEALLEMKSSNLSTKFKGFPSDFTLESHRWIRWTFRRYRNSSVFKSLRVFLKHLPIHWCIIWFPLDDIYINVLSRFLASLAVIETLPIAGINSFVARARQVCRATGNTACTTFFARQKSQLRHRHLSVIESCSRWTILIR